MSMSSRTCGKKVALATPGGAPGCSTSARVVPEMTARMNDADATAAAPAAQPTCRREFDDCSKIPKKVAANPPRKALKEAICLPVSARNSAFSGCIAIYRERDKRRQGVAVNTPKLFRNGGVGFIVFHEKVFKLRFGFILECG